MATKKSELKAQKDELVAQMRALYAKLGPINQALEDIEKEEYQESLRMFCEKYGEAFEVGKTFVVTPAIQAYAQERGFSEGYYRGWQVGQKAWISSLNPNDENYPIRAECDTGHRYRQGIGLNDEQRNKMIPLLTPDAPMPPELIAEAINGKA